MLTRNISRVIRAANKESDNALRIISGETSEILHGTQHALLKRGLPAQHIRSLRTNATAYKEFLPEIRSTLRSEEDRWAKVPRRGLPQNHISRSDKAVRELRDTRAAIHTVSPMPLRRYNPSINPHTEQRVKEVAARMSMSAPSSGRAGGVPTRSRTTSIVRSMFK